ncbi:MAG: MFS transporter, partial [Chloroflexi bacterium]|nr:MFS transporter [Chloroflexota bacterium]
MSHAVTVDTSRALTQMRRALSLSSFPIGVLTLGIPIYAPDKLGVSATQVGDLLGIYALMTLLMRPFIGPAMDRWGRRRFFIAGLALQMVSNLFFAAGASYEWLFWGRIVQGIAAGMLWISAYAITADLAAQGKQGNLFGSVEEMLARGGLYGAVIGAPLLLFTNFDQTAWSLIFLLYAVLNAFGLVVAIRDVPETWQHVPHTPQLLDSQQIHWLKLRLRQTFVDLPRPLFLLAFIVVFTSTANAGLSPILI